MKPLHIVFLWHQHQPYYKNPQTGEYLLPWVRLHCTKDYFDMVAILEKYPNIRQTFNLTPSLMEQIIDYSNGATDEFLKISRKPAKELSREDRIFILKNFFMVNPYTMIEPYPAYNELFRRRGWLASDDYLKRIEPLFSVADMLDLVVWFNLSWVDPYFRETNEKIKKLFIKGKKFSEEDKQHLLDETTKIVSLVLPKHKELQDKGQVEVITSPYYHPILPLLIDSNIAKVGMPFVTLPKSRFNYPEDAEIQIKNGLALYEKIFQRKSKGMWPSEGSVSSDIVPMVAKNNINWIATDEETLFKTLNMKIFSKDVLYKPYRIKVDDSSVNIIFRDHELSDLIGFVYHRVDAETAANNFIERLYKIKSSLKDNEDHLVSIILDGENCWEYYPNDGIDFLNALYRRLSDEEKNGLITTTVSNYLEKYPPKDELKGIFPSSWINGNFGIWIGHPEDNLAWDCLNQTRRFLASKTQSAPPENVRKAWEEIYIAEGSDWNWWYGDDHSSMNDTEFDQLFRAHLINVYKLLNENVPDNLYLSIKRQGKPGNFINPVAFIKPNIDGIVSSYFEWYNAGFYDVRNAGGAMHQTNTYIKAIYWGFDENNLYFRCDCNQPYLEDIKLKIIFIKPETKFIEINSSKNYVHFGTSELKDFAIGKKGIIEFSVPFSEIGTKAGDTIEFVVVSEQKGIEIERWPYHTSITLNHPDKHFSEEYWSV
ncbi:MAG: glycoside hydrolase family 57 protein [Elusimicrobia bacterium]|nr:glycoside hydrolase family 57 protein [Elusimicrobiota bacterium]